MTSRTSGTSKFDRTAAWRINVSLKILKAKKPNSGLRTGILYLTRVCQVIQGFSGSYRKFNPLFPALWCGQFFQRVCLLLIGAQVVLESTGYPTPGAIDFPDSRQSNIGSKRGLKGSLSGPSVVFRRFLVRLVSPFIDYEEVTLEPFSPEYLRASLIGNSVILFFTSPCATTLSSHRRGTASSLHAKDGNPVHHPCEKPNRRASSRPFQSAFPSGGCRPK
jgi:hypothetical protein